MTLLLAVILSLPVHVGPGHPLSLVELGRDAARGSDERPDRATPPASPIVHGTASHVGYRFGRRYLALPEHRWGRPGIRVTVCDVDPETPGDGCVTRTSTDAGPALHMQRQGRVADMSAQDFTAICDCPAGRGLVRVEVRYGQDSGGGGPRPTPPATDLAGVE